MAINVLITSVGTASAINVIKALRRQDELEFFIISADMKPLASGLYMSDRYYVVPKATSSEFIPKILEICKKERVKIWLPIFSKEIEIVAQNKEIFEKEGIIVPVSDYEVIKMCNDKLATRNFFIRHNIPTPKIYTDKELDNPKILEFPLFIKPKEGRGSVNSYKVVDVSELQFFRNYIKEPIVMEYVDGDEYTVDILTDNSYNLIVAVPRIRLATKAGQCVKGKTIKDEEIIEWTQKIVKFAKVKGQCNVQCFRTKDGKLLFTEINPRFAAGGLMLAVVAGANIPLLLIKMLLGKKVEKCRFKEGLYMLRYWEEVFVENKKLAK